MYTEQDILEYVEQEEVRFIRLAFCDLFGVQKNISILPEELPKAFSDGISFDASAICGFGDEVKSDLFLFPDPSTLTVLPWRSLNGRVIRLFCNICYPDGKRYERDSRYLLQQAIEQAKENGISCNFASEFEFYLLKTGEAGEPTREPFDQAGYMDIAPEDKGENIRREICTTLEDMDIHPEASHHEEGPGQNEIDFRYSDPLTAADHAVTFLSVVKTIAARNGLYASFAPKPLPNQSGNGMHINMSVQSSDGKNHSDAFMAGILKHICEITAFLNPTKESYRRLGEKKAPRYVTWSRENRSQLIRIPAAKGRYQRIELRSADAMANPYLAYALLIHAGLNGIQGQMQPPPPTDLNLFLAPSEVTDELEALPGTLEDAIKRAANSALVRCAFPESILTAYKLFSK